MKRTSLALIAAVAVIVAAALAYSYLESDDGSAEGRFDYTLTPVTEDTFQWSAPDEAQELLDDAIAAYLEASSDEDADMASALEALYGTCADIAVQYTGFYWDYFRDPGSCSEYYTGWVLLSSSMDSQVDEALRESLMGVNGDAVRALIGDDEADRVLSSESLTEEIETLLEAEAALVDAYYNYSGDRDGYAEIVLELVGVRNSIAEYYGYEDYVDYAYALIWGRDYGPDEADRAKEAVKGYVSELDMDIYRMIDADALNGLYSYAYQEELFEYVAPFIDGICPEFAEIYDYMLEYGLIDFEYLETKIEGVFTNYVRDADGNALVYIYNYPYLNYHDVYNLVHEFGHAAHLLLNDVWCTDYDILEVHSQGLEALLASDPDAVFGDGGETFTLYMLYNKTGTIMTACLVDDFEKALYRGDVTTAEEIEELWNGLLDEYGIGWYDWSEVRHIFEYPLYAISYAVSAFSALEIFTVGIEDPDAAVDLYLDIVAYSDNGINGMTEALGMMSFFDEDDLIAICEAIQDYIGNL